MDTISSHTAKLLSLVKDKKIFLVDDSRSYGAGMTEILRSFGCEVHFCSKPLNALEEATEYQPDVIMSDFEMPEINGPEMIRRFRCEEVFLLVPILILTGRADESRILEAISSGADEIMTKDSKQHAIMAKICAMIRLRNLNKAAAKSKQWDAVKAMIGTYKHEFGNVLTILEGNYKRLERANHFETTDPAVKVKESFVRIRDILKKLDALRDYEESEYTGSDKILKIS